MQETKKKGKGQKQYPDYLVIYSGIERQERAKEGVAIAIHTKYQNKVVECRYISSRILIVTMQTGHQKINILSIYAPEDNKPK